MDYLAHKSILKPIAERRASLGRWGFICACPRCSQADDDTRQFPCSAGGACAGYHAACHPDAAAIPGAPQLRPCSVCGAAAAPAYETRMIKEEAKLAAKLARVNAVLDSGSGEDVVGLVRGMTTFSDRHHLTHGVAFVRNELHSQFGELKEAAAALRLQLSVWDAILGGLPLMKSAFAAEYLGKACAQMGGAALPEARAAFQRARRMLRIVSGPETGYAMLIVRLLKEVDARLAEPSSARSVSARGGPSRGAAASGERSAAPRGAPLSPAGSASAPFPAPACAFCGATDAPLKRCGACHSPDAAYCCKEDQRAAWPVHKKVCKTTEPGPADK